MSYPVRLRLQCGSRAEQTRTPLPDHEQAASNHVTNCFRLWLRPRLQTLGSSSRRGALLKNCLWASKSLLGACHSCIMGKRDQMRAKGFKTAKKWPQLHLNDAHVPPNRAKHTLLPGVYQTRLGPQKTPVRSGGGHFQGSGPCFGHMAAETNDWWALALYGPNHDSKGTFSMCNSPLLVISYTSEWPKHMPTNLYHALPGSPPCHILQRTLPAAESQKSAATSWGS